MKIAVYGAAGMIGSRITQEALHRGHSVLALVRTQGKLKINDPRLVEKRADASNEAEVVSETKSCDAVVNAISPRNPAGPGLMAKAAQALLAGLRKSGVKRLVVVGGAGSLEVAPGHQLVDSPQFPEAYKAEALAQREALGIYRGEKALDWTYVSPAMLIEPGQRTGRYRVGGDQVLKDEKGDSKISAEDYAVAVLDELERPAHVRKRITVAY